MSEKITKASENPNILIVLDEKLLKKVSSRRFIPECSKEGCRKRSVGKRIAIRGVLERGLQEEGWWKEGCRQRCVRKSVCV